MALPFISQYPSDKIPNRQTMTAEQFADAVHPYLNFWNDTTIPQVNAWRESLEQIRQDINAKHQDVMNQAVDGGYSQAYIDNKFNQIWHGQTFYVDQQNGDDANDGSSVSPFKTIKKAIDSVSIGGYGVIYLNSDVVIDGEISTGGKNIYIYGYRRDGVNEYRYKINFRLYLKGSYNTSSKFIYGGNITFYYCDIGFIDETDANYQFDSFAQIFSYQTMFMSILWNIYLNKCKVTLPDKQMISVTYANSASGGGFVNFNAYLTEFNSLGLNSFAFKLNNGSMALNLYSCSATGSKINFSDLISGIVKDSNGVPRNIISSIIF